MAGNGINAGRRSPFTNFLPDTYRDRASIEQLMYTRVLMELSMNRFKWNDLPPGVDERYIEMTLFRSGLCVFYFDEEYDRFFALNGTGSGPINMYNNPTHFRVTAPQVSKTLSATRTAERGIDGSPVLGADGLAVMRPPECVPIWANYLRCPDWDIVEVYVSRLVEMEKTIDVTVATQRHPFIVTCDRDMRQSLVNAFRQVQEGQPIIWGVDSLADVMSTGVQALDVGVDKDLLLNLMMAKSRIWNECMTMLGIDNGNQDKKERMVVAEATANSDQVTSMRMAALKSREIACELINETFDLNVSVEWNVNEPKGQGDMGMMLPMLQGDDEDVEQVDERNEL